MLDQAQALLAPAAEGEVNTVIQGLEEQRQRQQAAAEDAATLLARTELLHEELLLRWQKQKQQTALHQEQGRQRLEHSIREGQKEVRSLIRRLRDEQADGETARKAGQTSSQSWKTITVQQKKSVLPKPGWRPEVGERVRLLAVRKGSRRVGHLRGWSATHGPLRRDANDRRTDCL